jgi:hypothetical protein
MDNRLDRAAIGEQGDHDDNQLRWLAQSLHHGSSSRVPGVTTGTTAIALTTSIMNTNVALFDLASCGTRQIRAELSGRVHWLSGCDLHTPKMPGTVTFFNQGLLFHRLAGLYPFPDILKKDLPNCGMWVDAQLSSHTLSPSIGQL